MRPERFELPTYCSGGNRSIHLSYGRTPENLVYMDGMRSINGSTSIKYIHGCNSRTPLRTPTPGTPTHRAASTIVSSARFEMPRRANRELFSTLE